MSAFGNDLGLSDLLYRRITEFGKDLSKESRQLIAKFIKHTIYIFSIGGPVMTIPQVTKIFMDHTAAGLSLLTWGSYLFFAFFWMNYGILIKNKPIIIANALGMVINFLTLLGIIIYR